MGSSLVDNVNKIAILRANAIGDLVFIMPAAYSIRKAYPAAEITLIAKDWQAEFFKNRTSPFDKIIVSVPYYGVTYDDETLENKEQQQKFFALMQKQAFDIALQMHGGGRYSNAFTKSLGAKLTVGSRTLDAPKLDRYIPYFYWHQEVLRNLEIASLIGATTASVRPLIEMEEQDYKESEKLLKDYREKTFVVFHLGAKDPRRRWEVSKFVEVALWLQQQGFEIVVIGGPEDKAIAKKFVDMLKRPALDLSGKSTISGMLGVLKTAKLVVANDSGPRHLAEAIGTPTVGIYWAGNVINAGPITRGNQRIAISWTTNCPVCFRSCVNNFTYERCEHDVSFVNDVSVREVIDQVKDLLDEEIISL